MEVLIPKSDAWYVSNPSAGNHSRATLVGPFHDSGNPWQRINFAPSELSSFRQGGRMFGETSVEHRKVDGNIYIIPALKNAVPTQSRDNITQQLIYGVKARSSGGASSTFETTLDFLLAGSDSYAYVQWGNKYAVSVTRIGNTITSGHAALSGSARPDSSGKYRWTLSTSVLEVVSTTSTSARVRSSVTIDGYRDELVKGNTLADGTILAQKANSYRSGNGSTTSRTKWFLEDAGFSMAEIRQWINRALHPDLFQHQPSPDLQSWGELVHAATGNLDALAANMIAFLKDLRNIKDLAPG